ncbi:MAG: type II secretion system protein [bacterium]|jgi:prepilin-type N-terminal cleavage/methylation domain-containing protein|nr:type II secretion system protein [Bacillota bacterium]HHW55218.1 type II secretion system protein [Bacillota bacterium]
MERCWENRGFTLVETIVVTALVSIIFTTVALYYQTAFGIWDKGNRQGELQQQARIALTKLVSDLQQTKTLRYQPRGTASWRDLPAGHVLVLLHGGSRVQLSIPPVKDGEPDLKVDYYISTTESGEITLIRHTGGYNSIALDIVQVELRLREEKPLVEIELVAAREGAEVRLVTSAYLRNLQGAVN